MLPLPPDCLCGFYKAIVQETSHFATFPEELPERCIKAGSSQHGVCPSCGAPWQRIITKAYDNPGRDQEAQDEGWKDGGKASKKGGINSGSFPTGLHVTTVGWEPTCSCFGIWGERMDYTGDEPKAVKVHQPGDDDPPPVPSVVLDIFAGSGTTIAVARRLGRRSIGIELNESGYGPILRKRTKADVKDLFSYGATPK